MSNDTFKKRQKELARLEKQRKKAARWLERRSEKAAKPPLGEAPHGPGIVSEHQLRQ